MQGMGFVHGEDRIGGEKAPFKLADDIEDFTDAGQVRDTNRDHG